MTNQGELLACSLTCRCSRRDARHHTVSCCTICCAGRAAEATYPLAGQPIPMRVPFAVLIGFLAAGATVGGAQIGYLWSFDELRAKADVVVIAEHIKTIDTTRRTDHPTLKPSLPVIELESAFNVLAVLIVNGAGCR